MIKCDQYYLIRGPGDLCVGRSSAIFATHKASFYFNKLLNNTLSFLLTSIKRNMTAILFLVILFSDVPHKSRF